MSTAPTPTTADAVRAAVAAVTDPEYPDLTIEDLGILERVDVAIGTADRCAARAAPEGAASRAAPEGAAARAAPEGAAARAAP
jgi:metal-sulfur cluster biosynthetic enzyme